MCHRLGKRVVGPRDWVELVLYGCDRKRRSENRGKGNSSLQNLRHWLLGHIPNGCRLQWQPANWLRWHDPTKKNRLVSISHFKGQSLLTESAWGSLNELTGTACSVAISSGVLCRMNNGLPRHLNVTDLPSAISSNLISILAKANTSADALIDVTNWVTMALAE